MSVDIKRKKS